MSAQRWIVWVDGMPVLLGRGVEPTEENVNKQLRQLGRGPLVVDGAWRSTVNCVTPAVEMAVGDELTRKYPEHRPGQ